MGRLMLHLKVQVLMKTRSSDDADNGLDTLAISRGQQTWYHFESIATFR